MAPADQVGAFLPGLKEPIRRECAWNPQTSTPFQDLKSLIAYAVAFEASQKRTMPDRWTMDGTSADHSHNIMTRLILATRLAQDKQISRGKKGKGFL